MNNEQQVVGGTFCELEKAFDFVDHGIIPSKLNFCGTMARNMHLMNFIW